jgi:hypothetical protein
VVFMAYLPDWETLFEALYRVIRTRGFNPADWPDNAIDDLDNAFLDRMGESVAATFSDLSERPHLSVSERQQMWAQLKRDPEYVEYDATRDICNAIADRKIRVRFLLKKVEPTLGSPSKPIEGTVRNGDEVEIPPRLNPNDFDWIMSCPIEPWRRRDSATSWHFEWIELRREDVTAALCGDRGVSLPYPLSAVDPDIDAQDKPAAGAKTTAGQESADRGVSLPYPLSAVDPDIDAQDKPAAGAKTTAGQESAAIKALARHIVNNPQITRAAAKIWCGDQGFSITQRGFQSRVWPNARIGAGLPPLGQSGRKPKSSR